VLSPIQTVTPLPNKPNLQLALLLLWLSLEQADHLLS
jgi:hypothetical protein